MIFNFLSSLRLTMLLLLGLALVSIAGTIQPPDGLYETFYQSLWFRSLLALLAVNLTVCTIKTILRNRRDQQRFREALGSEQVLASGLRHRLPADLSPQMLGTALQAQGYRSLRQEDTVLAQRGRWGRWGSTVVHLSVLLIMLGALSAAFGFVGTLNIHIGDQSAVYFSWKEQQDVPLGFDFRLDHFEPVYYPIDLQFAAIDPHSKQVLETITSSEGETVPLPLPGFTAEIVKFLPFEEHLLLWIHRDGIYQGDYHAFGGKRAVTNPLDDRLLLRPVAFRDPLLQQLHSDVSILKDGQVVQKGRIRVNEPLHYQGINIYQTAYDRDPFGLWFAGFQFSRDPGKPAVWVGCVLLVIGLALAFAAPYRVVGTVRHRDELLLVALHGFRGEEGSRAFDQLQERLIAHGR